MRNSLNDLSQAERYLEGKLEAAEAAVFSARLILDPHLEDDVYWQQKSYDIIRQYGRQEVRRKIDHLHDKLFQQSRYSDFRNRILSFFDPSH